MTLPRHRWARRVVPAMLICLVALAAPLPSFDFVETAYGVAVPLPVMAEAGAAELDAVAAASDERLGDDRVQGATTAVEEFSVIGVSFDDAPAEPVMVRVRESGGWSEWMELDVELDAGPDAGTPEAMAASGTVTTEPVWVDDATGYEISIGAGDAPGANVELVREESRRVVTEATPLAGAAAPFNIHSRASWGARYATPGSSASGGLKMAVVHHTVSSNSYSQAQVPGILRSIQAYHMDGNGWSDIGYNFLVDKYGGIWEGRAGGIENPIIGAHAMGFNTGSVGVSVLGDYSATSATAASLESVSAVIGWRLWAYRANPLDQVTTTSGGSTSIPAGTVVTLPRVVGHRQVGATGCPGSIINSMSAIRSRAAAYFASFEAAHNPVGNVDEVRLDGSTLTVRGWTKDPDTDDPVVVHIAIGPIWRVVTANQLRPDVGAAFPGYGDRRGFAMAAPNLGKGTHKVCVYAINQGRGTGNPALSCSDVVVK